MNRKTELAIAVVSALCLITAYAAISMRRDKNKPNIIIISLDALRPDHLGCYGYVRDTSPNIDSFARYANLYLNCFSAGTWTIPSNYSLLTSLYPVQHNMYSWNSILGNNIPTIFSILRRHGYSQGFFSDSEFLVKNFKENFSQILDGCTDLPNALLVTRAAIKWMTRQRSPFFIWVYYLEPHRPYTPPPPHNSLYEYPQGVKLPIKNVYRDVSGGWDYIPDVVAEKNIQDANYYIAQYDGEIHYADEEVGRLLAWLKESGLFDRSLIILTSDHGESLGEHHLYFNHFTFFNEVLRVPMLIKMPGQRQGAVIKDNVSQIDILPTILMGARVNGALRHYEGKSLQDMRNKKRGFFAYVSRDIYCFIYDRWKLIKYADFWDTRAENIRTIFPETGQREYQFFNMEADPAELVDLRDRDAAKFRELLFKASCLTQKMKPVPKTGAFFSINDKERERLRSLGYVQ